MVTGAAAAVLAQYLGLWPQSGRALPPEDPLGTHPHLHATLSCHRRLGRWVATLIVTNLSTELVYLTGYNLPRGGKLENNVFQFEGSASKVRYTGVYTKRGALSRSDCAELLPGASLDAEVVLDDWYALPSESAVVWYEAFHNPPDSAGTLWLVRSNKVELGV